MEYQFTTGVQITEAEALEEVAVMGFHGLAFDDVQEQDETLHWHEFDAVTWVISGSGSIEDERGKVTEYGPGCRLQAPRDISIARLRAPTSGWSSGRTCQVKSGPARSTRSPPTARLRFPTERRGSPTRGQWPPWLITVGLHDR